MLALKDRSIAEQPSVAEQLGELARRAVSEGHSNFLRQPGEPDTHYLRRLSDAGLVAGVLRSFGNGRGTAHSLPEVLRGRFVLVVDGPGGLDAAVARLEAAEVAA